ncbi:MAG TPA: 3-oxoacyl-ACP reductase FabG [Anaerolineales bacterium]|nr:3-oxoacyl-ACP reductase FabG [Anaerolineales bacterium]
MRLKDKVAWITGAGSGIGRATALRFAHEGARLFLTDVEEAGLTEVAAQIRNDGGKAESTTGDVSDRAEVARMVEQALQAFERLDILINNAGINRDGLVVKAKDDQIQLMGDDRWDPVVDVNLKGSFLCAQAAAVPMMRQDHGRIVNTSSIGALGNIGQANYAASKAGVIGLTKTLALEWARFHINVNCVAPGATETRMTAGMPEKLREGLVDKIPLRRLARPEEIAAAHLFLVSDDAVYITGQVLFVDGGISVGV